MTQKFKKIQNLSETKGWHFEKVGKIQKPLARLNKKKGQES